MAKITWLGEDEADIAGPSFTTWHDMRFNKGVPVEITNLDVITKARRNRYFKVDGGPGRPPKDRADDDKDAE